MNKKFFTLLAASLMLMIAAAANAQFPLVGDTVTYLPGGQGTSAYHLQITYLGNNNPQDSLWVLALDDNGYVFRGDSTLLRNDLQNDVPFYKRLRQALWCVTTESPSQGRRPTFQFVNKDKGVDLSFSYDKALFSDTAQGWAYGAWTSGWSLPLTGGDLYGYPSGYATTKLPWPNTDYSGNDAGLGGKFRIRSGKMGNSNDAYVTGGDLNKWRFSLANVNKLDTSVFLAIDLQSKGETDFFVTMAWDTVTNVIKLVKVHSDDLLPGSPFYNHSLIRFTMREAAPRVLTVEDFNTKFGEQPEGDVQLIFTPDKKNTTFENPFTQYKLIAEKGTAYTPSTGAVYLKLKATGVATGQTGDGIGKYVSVATGDNRYANATGKRFLKFDMREWASSADARKLQEFRFVYYPTNDSLVINARRVEHNNTAYHNDFYEDVSFTYGITDIGGKSYPYHNAAIFNGLIVRAQTLDAVQNSVIITVDNYPSNVHIGFGVSGCATVPDGRTSVPTDLYTIRNSRGQYLTVPLYTGTYTPQWVFLDENEVPEKTPAFQWLVVQVNEKDSKTSKIHLINREFETMHLNYIQVYTSWQKMDFTDASLGHLGAESGYTAELKNGLIRFDGTTDGSSANSSFKVVKDDPAAKAIYDAAVKSKAVVPAQVWEKLYRTSPYLGYKYISGVDGGISETDTLNYYTYSFNYLHAFSSSYYLGFEENPKTLSDTTLVALPGSQFFQLAIPDEIRADGDEAYGIGYDADLTDTDIIIKTAPYVTKTGNASKEEIAKLKRRYYYLRISDLSYWNYKRNDNYLLLDRNKRYVYTDEFTAKESELPASKFYLRFTYQPTGKPEYYTLLDRINASDFKHLAAEYGLYITDTLRALDNSHGAYNKSSGYGVLQISIDDNNLVARAQVKVGGARVSTFALSRVSEPLYRRFNTKDELVDGNGALDDMPKTLKFYEENSKSDYLYEDRMSRHSYIPGYAKQINYLGTENEHECADFLATDPIVYEVHKTHNYAVYVDTAYINRGTGWIKPQYMLVMQPEFIETVLGCNKCGNPITPIGTAVYGRYLINAMDSARANSSYVGAHKPIKQPNGSDYIWATDWERLIFVPAIHLGDTLFIFKGYTSAVGNPSIAKYMQEIDGEQKLDLDALNRDSKNGLIDKKTDLGNNFHKDYVFQFRFVERQYDDQGKPKPNVGKHFLIESETTNRSIATGRMIAPMEGGWVKIDNEVPVISRGAYGDAIMEAEWFNVKPTNDKPLDNETVDAAKVTVVAGAGSVNILNASGKSVVISNVLGQIVANTVLTSDNATLAAPKGIVVVAVEGEETVKAIVK